MTTDFPKHSFMGFEIDDDEARAMGINIERVPMELPPFHIVVGVPDNPISSAMAELFGGVPRVDKRRLAALAIQLARIAQGVAPMVVLDKDMALELCKVVLDLQDTRRILQECFADRQCAMGSKTIDILGDLLPRDQDRAHTRAKS